MRTYQFRLSSKKVSHYLIMILAIVLIVSTVPNNENKALSCGKGCDQSYLATPIGLTATSGSAMVTLNWNANKEANLVFYRVYKDGTFYRTYNKETTSIEVTDLTAEQDYTFGVAAVNTSNHTSAIIEAVSAPLSEVITQASFIAVPSGSFPQYDTFFNHSEAGPFIPGLAQNLIPQGLTYDSVNNWLIAFNSRPDKKSAIITVMNGTSGAFIKSLTVYNSDETPYEGHAGGIAVTTYDVWISGMGFLHRIPLEDIVSAPNRSKVYINDRFHTGNVAAFALYQDGVLWAGEFHEATDFPTSNSHHKTTRNGKSNRAWMIGFTLNPSTGRLPDGKYLTDDQAVIPDKILSITDKIQGAATLLNRGIVLSQSYGRDQDSKIYYYKDVLSQPPHYYSTVGGELVPSWFLDDISLESELIAPPMAEGMVVKNGFLHVLFESASIDYLSTEINRKKVSKVVAGTLDENEVAVETVSESKMYPVDAIWKININSLLQIEEASLID